MPYGMSDATNRYLDALVLTCIERNPTGVSATDILTFGKTRFPPHGTCGQISLTLGRVAMRIQNMRHRGLITDAGTRKIRYKKVKLWKKNK